jgi:hypothetical protein
MKDAIGHQEARWRFSFFGREEGVDNFCISIILEVW